MQIIILCGGIGTRLKEETEFKPKPMVCIGNRPIIWHIMKIYATYGHSEFILALGYKGEIIKDYFYHYEIMNNDVTLELGKPDNLSIHKSHSEMGWKVTLANTGEKTLKGGRIKRIEKYITGDIFMLTYGDGVSDIDINDLLAFHKQHGKMATVTGISPTSRFGELKTHGASVESFSEKPNDGTSVVNGGFFVFNRDILNYLTEEENCDLEIGALEEVAKAGELMVFRHKGFWASMDTLRDTEYLNRLWSENKAPWKVW
jgi:glucose-1-phosphate cytidylyltransferase